MESTLKETEIKTAVYVRISTTQQKTERQVVESMGVSTSLPVIIWTRKQPKKSMLPVKQ